jgi:hypothetical protein
MAANIGFAATGVAAIATGVVALFFTDWDRAAKAGRAPRVAPVVSGAAVTYGVSF